MKFEQPDEKEFLEGIQHFFEKRRLKTAGFGRYSFAPGGVFTYWSSGYAALCLSLTGLLRDIDEKQRLQWIDYLQKGQDPETGFFKEPVDESNAPAGPIHHARDIYWHGATFAAGALHVLGAKPLHPFKCIDEFKNTGKMIEWIEKLPWHEPWKTGNWTYDMGCLMGNDYIVTNDTKNLNAMDAFFDWHDRNVDGETGWWNIKNNPDLYKSQFGGYHTLMVYWMFQREVPDPEKMIKSSLTLQSGNSSYQNMGCCGDMDVIDTVVTLSRQYGICEREVKQSVEKFYPFLMDMLDKDGGFIGKHDEKHIDLGWKNHEGEIGKADPCSTYFRTFTLSLVSEILEIGRLDNIEWKHMDGFCHGRRPDCLL